MEEVVVTVFLMVIVSPRKKVINHNGFLLSLRQQWETECLFWGGLLHFGGVLIIKAHLRKSSVLYSQTHLSWEKPLASSSLTTNLTVPNPPLNFNLCWTSTQMDPTQQYCHPKKEKEGGQNSVESVKEQLKLL